MNSTARSLLRPLLLIVICPLCFPEPFSHKEIPASFCICLGDSKRLTSPTSARNPATVITPIPLMTSRIPTFNNQLCDYLRILPVILALTVVIQFLGLLYRIRVNPNQEDALILKISAKLTIIILWVARTFLQTHYLLLSRNVSLICK